MMPFTSTPSPMLSTPGHEKPSGGEPRPKLWTPFSAKLRIPVLRGLVESAQYLSIRYTERLGESGIVPAVGSVGDSYDNALAETVIGLFKTEIIRRLGLWRSLDAVEIAALEWIDCFNHGRLLEPIGNIPPAEAEERCYAEQETSALAAKVSKKPAFGNVGAVHGELSDLTFSKAAKLRVGPVKRIRNPSASTCSALALETWGCATGMPALIACSTIHAIADRTLGWS
jgi:hypothetical protein